MDFKNFNVLITGATGGIGRDIVHTFYKSGANVVAIDINPVKLKQMSNVYTERFNYKVVDLRQSTQLYKTLEELHVKYDYFHILINCAGVTLFSDFYETTLDDWNQVIDVNLKAPFIISQQMAIKSKLHDASYGRIINIASTRAIMSEASTEAYSASKGGIVSLTHAMAISLADTPITVNAVSPGWIETIDYDSLNPLDHSQHPSGRVGKPSDISKVCLFLCDPANDFINGENMIIDGGMTKKMIYQDNN